jgi:hypothetical protein
MLMVIYSKFYLFRVRYLISFVSVGSLHLRRFRVYGCYDPDLACLQEPGEWSQEQGIKLATFNISGLLSTSANMACSAPRMVLIYAWYMLLTKLIIPNMFTHSHRTLPVQVLRGVPSQRLLINVVSHFIDSLSPEDISRIQASLNKPVRTAIPRVLLNTSVCSRCTLLHAIRSTAIRIDWQP